MLLNKVNKKHAHARTHAHSRDSQILTVNRLQRPVTGLAHGQAILCLYLNASFHTNIHAHFALTFKYVGVFFEGIFYPKCNTTATRSLVVNFLIVFQSKQSPLPPQCCKSVQCEYPKQIIEREFSTHSMGQAFVRTDPLHNG